MATTFNFGAIVIPNGITQLPDRTVPVGTTDAVFTLDIATMTAAQSIFVDVHIIDDTGYDFRFYSDQSGPGTWVDKHGVTQTTFKQSFGWGRPATAGWIARSVVTMTNGPLSSAGGSLQLLP